VSANPTNKIQDGLNKRVWKFEIQGNLLPSQDGYILRFDFSNVEAPLTYSFEEDVVGVYTLNKCKPQNARGVFSYTFDSTLKILDLYFFNGTTITKQTAFYFSLAIFDAPCCKDCGCSGGCNDCFAACFFC
jgi:hypothetical protein